jgi:hypothetical protein
VLLFLLWLAAIVVWRQRWAWVLMLLLDASVVLAPIWGESSSLIPYAVNVLSLGLLLSPGMRGWVNVTSRSHPQPST